MKVKLFTHTDLDGIGCGIVGKYAFDNIDIEYCNYDDVDYKISKFIADESYKYDLIFITDISVNETVANEITEFIGHKTKLIDHHATAKWLNKYNWAFVNDYEMSFYPGEDFMKSSGTSLLYDYLWNNHEINNGQLVEFVEKVRRYDTWEWSTKFNDVHAKQLNDLLYIIGRDKFTERFVENASINFTDSEKMILDVEKSKIEHYIKTKIKQLKTFDILNYQAGVVFAEHYSSELGNELAKTYNNLDFIAIINPSNAKVSYRGIKDHIDLGNDVAKVFGGGGHPKSAGSQINEELINRFIENVFNVK